MRKIREAITSVRFWRVTCLAALGLSLIPVLLIAFDNHSVSDDYAFGAAARLAWTDTHSLWAVLEAAWGNVVQNFYEWQGTYSAIFLFSLQPAIFGEQYYFLSTFVLVGMFVFSHFYFFRKAFHGLSSEASALADIAASVILLIAMQLAPSPVNCFFWWNGSVYYAFFHAVLLVYAANLLALLRRPRRSMGLLLSTTLLGVFVAGGNFITALLAAELTALALLYALFERKEAVFRLLPIFVFVMAGFLVSCLAPGNSVRQAKLEGEAPLHAIALSFQAAYRAMAEYTSPPVALGLLFLAPLLWRLPVKALSVKGRRAPLPVLLALLFCLFASTFAPTFYSGIGDGYDRIYNIRFFLWALLLTVALLLVMARIKGMLAEVAPQEQRPNRGIVGRMLRRYGASYFGVILLCLCLIVGFNVYAGDRNLFMSVSAANSLLNGEAELFDAVADDRIATLLGEEQDVILPVYPCRPHVLYMGDFDVYRNDTVARFYRKNSVRLDYDLAHTSALGDTEE